MRKTYCSVTDCGNYGAHQELTLCGNHVRGLIEILGYYERYKRKLSTLITSGVDSFVRNYSGDFGGGGDRAVIPAHASPPRGRRNRDNIPQRGKVPRSRREVSDRRRRKPRSDVQHIHRQDNSPSELGSTSSGLLRSRSKQKSGRRLGRTFKKI